MSEIQEAAEIITSAVAPDANIIFGATLKPDLEDELIITVIATGFDSAFFENQSAAAPSTATAAPSGVPEETVSAINLDLDQTDAAASFAEEPTRDIWTSMPEEDDESDMPAFLRRRKKNKQSDES
jgi:cell division protein FtsZ